MFFLSPFYELVKVSDLFDKTYGSDIWEFSKKSLTSFHWDKNEVDGKIVYTKEFEIPGISKDMIDITIDEQMLIVKVTKSEKDIKTFKIYLPKNVDENSLRASLDLGILKIMVDEKQKNIKDTPKIKWLE